MENKQKFRPNPEARLLDQVREVLRYHHYAYRTEQTYCEWIVRYVKFHKTRKHPREMGKTEIEAFLSHLATHGNVAVSTQRQAMHALLFLYQQVLDMPMNDEISPIKARRNKRPPIVLTQAEVQAVLAQMSGVHSLMASILYGGGLRLMECIRMRTQDIDFHRSKIYVRDGKGGQDRVALLPLSLHSQLRSHLGKVKQLHEQDLAAGYAEVYLPHPLSRKYPSAAREFGWQYLFPAKKVSEDPRSGVIRRHHVLESGLQKAVRTAVRRAGIEKHVGCHTLRHSFATHLLEKGVNIRVVQELMGHADVKTTEIYTHVMQKNLDEVSSPLDVIMASDFT